MRFLDANLSYGYITAVDQRPPSPCETFAELVAALRRAGIAGGLVRTEATDESGVALGNELLREALSSAPDNLELFGMYTLLPAYTHEIPPAADLPDALKAGGFGALRLAPEKHRYLPKAGVLADYLDMASEKEIPVVFDTSTGINIGEAYDIMERFPNLTAVLSYHNIWPTERYERPFLAQFPKLRMDLSAMIIDQGIEGLVAEYGARRFLFGSRFPRMYIGGAMLQLRRADIAEEGKEAIAGGNLLEMLKWSEPI